MTPRKAHQPISKHERTVLAAGVYDSLKWWIMDQRIPPGARLNIDALAQELEVSPTPVRESLARLAAERLVTFEPFKGYAVCPPLTPHQVADLLHVRRLIEVEALRLAAPRLQLPDLLQIEALLEAIESIQTGATLRGRRQFIQLDHRFHEIIVTACGNEFLLEAHRFLHIHVQLTRFNPRMYTEQDCCETRGEHRRIYQALAQHDAPAAIQALEQHLDATERRVFSA